jgi:hypothetical protein
MISGLSRPNSEAYQVGFEFAQGRLWNSITVTNSDLRLLI